MDIKRRCPYCGKMLNRPYWAHLAQDHPDEYNNNKATWVQLYQDYRAAGMAEDVSITVVSELFNADPGDVRKLLKREGVLN